MDGKVTLALSARETDEVLRDIRGQRIRKSFVESR
jgi:hypothetical protein